MLLAVVAIAVVAVVNGSRSDSPGDWLVSVGQVPPGAGWVLRDSATTPFGETTRSSAIWEDGVSSERRSLGVYVDDYGTEGSARAKSAPPEDAISAPNFEVSAYGDPTQLPLARTDWTDYITCGSGTSAQCSWWVYYAELGRYRVTVVYRDIGGDLLSGDDFIEMALMAFEPSSATGRSVQGT